MILVLAIFYLRTKLLKWTGEKGQYRNCLWEIVFASKHDRQMYCSCIGRTFASHLEIMPHTWKLQGSILTLIITFSPFYRVECDPLCVHCLLWQMQITKIIKGFTLIKTVGSFYLKIWLSVMAVLVRAHVRHQDDPGSRLVFATVL